MLAAIPRTSYAPRLYDPETLYSLFDGWKLIFDAEQIRDSDGASLQVWSEGSGTYRDAVNTTSNQQGVFSASGGPNDRPYVAFDGTNDRYQWAFTPQPSRFQVLTNNSFTFTAVFKLTDLTGNRTLFSSGLSTTSANYALIQTVTGIPRINLGGTVSAATSAVSTTDWHILMVIRDEFVNTIYVDGTLVKTDTVSVYLPTPDLAALGCLYRQSTAEDFFKGRLALLAVNWQPFGSTDRTTLFNYLRNRYRTP